MADVLFGNEPFTGRLPTVHRLDVSLQRGFDTPLGRLLARAAKHFAQK